MQYVRLFWPPSRYPVVVLGWLAVNISLQSLIQPPLPETAAYRQLFNPWANARSISVRFVPLCFICESPSLSRHQRRYCNMPAVSVEYKAFQTAAMQRQYMQGQYTKNSKQIFPEMKQRSFSPSYYINVFVSDL